MSDRVDATIASLLIVAAVAIAAGRRFDHDDRDDTLQTSAPNSPPQSGG